MKIKKVIIFLVLTFLIISPVLALAQTAQQQNYPNVGGNQLISNTASESIPKLVMYIFNLAVWLCILTVIIVLIVGGVQYLTSSGQVSKMASAKTRIYSSLLGLVILIGAWFVLHTMNPQIVIPKITYVPLKSGIFLFTENGYKSFLKATDESIINDLLQSQEAFYLSNSTPDLTKEFGQLVWYGEGNAKHLNFENFQLYAIGFWGKKDAQSIVVFYGGKDYNPQNIKKYFSIKGEVDENGNEKRKASLSYGMQYIKFMVGPNEGFNVSVDYLNVPKYVEVENPTTKIMENTVNDVLLYNKQRPALIQTNNLYHPPLSLKIIRNAPGVYLSNADGEERYFDASVANFKSADINFDQMAQDVKIINDVEYEYIDLNGEKKTEKESRDFLAILHEKDNFSGNLKIYFEQRSYDTVNSNNTHVNSLKGKDMRLPAYNNCGMPVSEEEMERDEEIGRAFLITGNSQGAANEKLSKFISKEKNPADFYEWKAYNFGNLPMILFGANPVIQLKKPIYQPENTEYPAYKLYEEERYGEIPAGKSISSVSVQELSKDQNICQEVRLCTEKSGRGYCLAYVARDNQSSKKENNTIFYPMPVYLPVPIPKVGNFFSSCASKPSPTVFDGSKDVEVNFQGNIKSIQIKGNCTVVLFGGNVINKNTALSMLPNIINYIYRLSVAGSRSEVFTSSDYNLEDNEIGMCGSSVGFGRWFNKSCATTIAVYPIK